LRIVIISIGDGGLCSTTLIRKNCFNCEACNKQELLSGRSLWPENSSSALTNRVLDLLRWEYYGSLWITSRVSFILNTLISKKLLLQSCASEDSNEL